MEHVCTICGKPTARISGNRYRKTCSSVCFKAMKQRDKETIQSKRKATTLQKYGVDHISKLDFVKEQKVHTSLEHFGTSHPLQNNEVAERVTNTNLLRYGETRATKTIDKKLSIGKANKVHAKEAKVKREDTNMGKYGVKHNMYLPEVQKKRKQTLINHYGVEIPLQNANLVKKMKQTNLERYGVENVAQNAEIKEKTKQTNLERYGANTTLTLPETRKKMEEALIAKYGEEVGKNRYAEIAKQNGGIHPIQLADRLTISVSQGELEVSNLLSNKFDLEVEQSNRTILKGKEIDIWIPDLRTGIEYNGVYWHSEAAGCGKNEMYNKYKQCKELGITLFNIWDFEWVARKEQILGFLASKFGHNQKIYARGCQVKLIEPIHATEFVNAYHIQPVKNSAILNYGLYYNQELVSVMSFRKHHRDNKTWVLSRLCSKPNITIVGGASKLFSFATKENNWKEVISWSDNRWSEGNVYTKMGFELKAEYGPDYQYYDLKHQIVIPKQAATKKKLNAVGQTEHERALELGLTRIWDCGKKAWVFKRP